MMRGLVLLTLMIACSGCMMIEDMLFVEDTQPGYPVKPPSLNCCMFAGKRR
jgi:hypothetical protein